MFKYKELCKFFERLVAPPMPRAVIGQHIVIDFKNKRLNAKVTAFNNDTRMIEATANGKKFLGERGGTFKMI